MPRIDITLRNATRIPLLGVRMEPKAYVIIECEEMSYTSPIAKQSQNPVWKYHTVIDAKKVTSFLHFYIYNNNPNTVDELLAFGKVEFGELMTRTNSEYKLRLMNSLEEPINSFLFIEHYDANPADLYLPLDDRTCIKLRLINDLPNNSYFICEYGENSFNLSGELNENAFRYNPKYDRIRCILKGNSRQSTLPEMETQILIGNIGNNNCLVLRFYGSKEEYKVFVSASIILNGLLPQNYNILTAKIGEVQKSNGKKNSNYQVRMSGPLNESAFNEKGECEIFVENNSQILVQYYQQAEKTDGVEPICSFKVPLNSLNWQSLQCSHQLKYYDSFKSTQTIINLEFAIKKNTQFSRITPKLNNTEIQFDQTSDMLFQQIKLQNCFLFQIIRNDQVQLFHVNTKGEITAFNKFIVADNKTEYVIDTRAVLKQGGRGVFYLVDLDQQFEQKPTASVTDSLILKINVEQPNKIEEAKIDFSSKFLAFAKKASVVNICKRFNQMVHDDLLKLRVKSRFTGVARKGILRLVNAKCTGSFGKVAVSISTDSVYKHMVGQIGNYLLQKSHCFYVSEGNIKVKAKIETFDDSLSKNAPQKGDKFVQVCFYGNFCDFFGTPSPSKYYSQQLKLSPIHKLQIIYSFEQGEKLQALPITKLNDLVFFDSKDCIAIQLKRVFVSVNNQSYRFRITRGSYTYQTHSYRCNNSKIYFQGSERCVLRVPDGQQINPIFISAYSHDEQGKLMIYNGFISAKDIVGRGQYEVQLVYEKQEKRRVIYFIMEVPHSNDYLCKETSAILKLNKITTNTFTPLFRTIYKHYLLVKVNGYQYDIFECAINEQSLTFNATINLRKSDSLILQMYSSYKAISKQLFNASEKELIGTGEAIWQQIEESGHFILSYSPKKESQLKFTKNTLAIQEKSYKWYVGYAASKGKLQGRMVGRRQKVATTEIDVLNKGVINLYLKELFMLQYQSKIISIQLKPISLQLTSQSSSKISKNFIIKAQNMQFALQATITAKQGEKYRKANVSSRVKLRGNHFKINQPTSIIISFEGFFYLTADITIFHNKFVSSPQGDLLIKQVGTRGVRVEKWDISFARQVDSDEDLNVLLKREGPEMKKCEIQLKTSNEMNGLICNLQGKGFKLKERICLSQVNLDQLDSEFVYERQLLVIGESLIITFILSYNSIKQVKQQEMSIKYQLQNSKSLTIQYSLTQYNTLKQGKTPSQIPNKNEGYLLKLTIPLDLAGNTKQVHIFPDVGDTIKLSPSASKSQEYIYYSPKLLSVRNIKLINSQYIDKQIEPLGKHLTAWKYMIDQNPKLICAITQTPCSISSIGNENWTFKFNFHRLINANRTRLLSLKNTPNDEILTKQLAVVVKHGKQCHFVRNLDEVGVTKTTDLQSLQFGYDSSCNILQVFLIIDNYFNQENSFDKLTSNWMELFPISYGTVNLSNVQPDLPFGFELNPLPNNSINLEKAINRMVIRSQGIACLCDLTFAKKSWGYLSLKLQGCTPITFLSKEKQQIYLYFKVEVEDGNREVVASFNTEARPAGNPESLQFTNNSIDFLLIQQSTESHYSIKLTGFILDKSNHYSFMQKKHDITDSLQRRGKQDINIQIKASQTNNLCKNTFQLTLQLRNSTEPPQRQNLIEKAKSINKVDALSFREIDSEEFFERLLGCQQLSHFNECLEQIKESFIYREDAQYSSFVFLIQYLSFNFDANLVGEICEIIHLNLLKCPQIISELEEEGITKILYDYFRLICQRERAKVPSKVTKITSEEYAQAINTFKAGRTLSNLMAVVEKQAYMLYTGQQMLTSLSSRNNEIILNIINLLLKNSRQMKESLCRDLDEWIEMFGFTTENNEFQLFLLVLKNSLLYGSQMSQKSLHRLIDILLQRAYGLTIVFDFWQQISEKGQQLAIYESILGKYEKEFERNAVETCRGVKMMLNHLMNSKNSEMNEQLGKMHSPIFHILLANTKQSNDILLLSSHFDLLVFLSDQGLMPEPIKNETSLLIKQKALAVKDNSSKLILSNYAAKFKGKTVKLVSTGKKDSLGEQMASKAGFYKKYLITSD